MTNTTEAALRDALEKIERLGSDGEHSGDRHARCREIARSALSQPPASSTVAQEVPAEATEAMIEAGLTTSGRYGRNAMKEIWARMYAASLSPSSGEPAEEKCSACLGENKAQGEYRCLQCDGTGLAKDNVWGEPASVAGEAVAWRYDCPATGEVKLRGGWERLEPHRIPEGWTETALGPLSKPTPVEAGLREAVTRLLGGRKIAGMYRMEQDDINFALAALSETLPASSLGVPASRSGSRGFAVEPLRVSPVPASIPDVEKDA